MKSVSSQDGAITVDVPESWSAGDSTWNSTAHPGTGIFAGTQMIVAADYRNSTVYIGASTAMPAAEDVAAMTIPDRQEWLDEIVDLDWGKDGCLPVSPEPKVKTGWTIATREWKECASTKGQRMLEFAALTDVSDVLVIGQITLTADTPDSVFDSVIESFVITPDKIPTWPSAPHPPMP